MENDMKNPLREIVVVEKVNLFNNRFFLTSNEDNSFTQSWKYFSRRANNFSKKAYYTLGRMKERADKRERCNEMTVSR